MTHLKILFVSLFLFSTLTNIASADELTKTQTDYFSKLSFFCGKTFTGKTLYPTDPADPFVGIELTLKFNYCSENEIRVPFSLAEDTSRTWIISKNINGLLLKHDHRHPDGTPDEITLYGGLASQDGTAFSQSFIADQDTINLIPEAATNVWQISINETNTQIVYYLQRNSKIRYKAIFTLTEK